MTIKKLLFITLFCVTGAGALASDIELIDDKYSAPLPPFFEDSFKSHFWDYKYFHKYWMGDIVALVGTSTAGKTSIINALKRLELDRLEDGVDLKYVAVSNRLIKKHYPNEIAIISEAINEPLADAVFNNKRSWKIGVSFEKQQQVEEAIKIIQTALNSSTPQEEKEIRSSFENMALEMFDDAFECSRRGKNIIFDVLNIKSLSKHISERNFNGPIRVILVYCPFYKLSSRMEKRNKEAIQSGDLVNQRIGEFPLVQFSKIYSQKEKKQNTFERITRNQAIISFNTNFDNGVANKRLQGLEEEKVNQTLSSKRRDLRKFLKNLGFSNEVDVVEIAPKNQGFYNMIINSNIFLPDFSAKIIHFGTCNRN